MADIVSATLAAMDRGHGTYNVGGPLEASLREAVAVFEKVAGRSLEVHPRPGVPGDVHRGSADTARIRAELGWEPQTSLEEGARAQWEWAADVSKAGNATT